MDSPLNFATNDELLCNDTSEMGRIGIRTKPKVSSWMYLSLSMLNLLLSVPKNGPLTTHVEGTSSSVGHMPPPKVRDSHVSRWKAFCNKLSMPKNQHLEFLVQLAQEMGRTKDHKLISTCLEFVDPGDR